MPRLTIAWGLLLVVQGLLPGATVYLTKLTINSFIDASRSEDPFLYFNQTLVLFVLTGASILFAEISRYLSDWTRSVQAEYFSDYLKNLIQTKSAEVDLEFYESSDYHDLMEQARGESQSKPLALLESFGSVIQNSITLLSFAALLFAYGWAIPLLLFLGTLPALFISLKIDRRFHRWWKQTAEKRRWLLYFDSMLTHSSAVAEMRLFDLSHRFRKRFQDLRQALRNEKFAHLRYQFSGKVLANGFSLVMGAIAVGWIARQVFYRTATLGDLAVFFQVFSRGQTVLGALFGSMGQTVNHTLYLQSLFSFLDLQPKIVSPPEPVDFPKRITDGIRFRDVTFRYPGETRSAVTNFNLFIPAGKIVALVGVNGAGKSTLIKLLCRFYDPTSGSIQIDGIDLRKFDVAQLRRNISVLFQFPLQFHETAADNIALGSSTEELRPEAIEAAATYAGAHDFISRLPQKYDSLLGKWFVKGCELSGGEWQRLALARAYYRQSQLIVLDEPTSFMDSWAEADWFDRLRRLAVGRTGLVITHRFTIAMRADIIHVMDQGKIIESGSHRDLVSDDGFYAESWRSQTNAIDGETVEALRPFANIPGR
ncbi:MAG TPA: ABC transporter ATP-binding protein [Pyrinomonadaceae bacterium]